MKCKKCGSENVTVSTEQVGGKTSTKRMGCLWSMGRLALIVCTCGLWLILGKKKETGKTKFKHTTVALCQNCGNKWSV